MPSATHVKTSTLIVFEDAVTGIGDPGAGLSLLTAWVLRGKCYCAQ